MAQRVWISEFTAGGRQQAQAPFASLPAGCQPMLDVAGGANLGTVPEDHEIYPCYL